MHRLDNVSHEDGVAGIGDDEEEEWMIHVEPWWATVQDVFTGCCGRRLCSFFVNLKGEGSSVLWKGYPSQAGASFIDTTSCQL